MKEARILFLLPTDFPKCECGHHRLDHAEDPIILGTGRCSRACKCDQFRAESRELD